MNLGPWEIIAILVVILLLFGAKKLPDLARSVGRSARIFKSEVKEMKNDDQAQAEQAAPAQPNDEDFWSSPENQPRQIEQQPPVQNPNQQQPQQKPNQHNQ